MAIEICVSESTPGALVRGNPYGPHGAPDDPPEQVPAGGIWNDFAATPPPPATAPPPTVGDAPADDGDGRPIASIGPLEKVCETVHPLSDTACSEGAMLPVGIIGLAATAGIAALDHRRQRRLLDTGATSEAVRS